MASSREKRNRAIIRRLRQTLSELENDADIEPSVEPEGMTNRQIIEFLRRRVKQDQEILREIINSSTEQLDKETIASRTESDRELADELGGSLDDFTPEDIDEEDDSFERAQRLAEEAGLELVEDVPDNYASKQLRRLLAFIEDAISYARNIPVPKHIIRQPDGFYRVVVDYE